MRLDTDAVLAAARAATAHNFGAPVRGHDPLPDGGVRVDLTSWPRAQEALRRLLELGYAAEDTAPPGGYGWSVVVTGWSPDGVDARVQRLRRRIAWLERDHDLVAQTAIDTFRELCRRHGTDVDDATRQAVHTAVPQVHGRDNDSVDYDVPAPEADLDAAPEDLAGALREVAALQAAHRQLVDKQAASAEGAIGLYLEYVHRHDREPDVAQAMALLEVAEGNRALTQLAREDLAARAEAVGGTAPGARG
jgi:hypothetical protein